MRLKSNCDTYFLIKGNWAENLDRIRADQCFATCWWLNCGCVAPNHFLHVAMAAAKLVQVPSPKTSTINSPAVPFRKVMDMRTYWLLTRQCEYGEQPQENIN